MQEVIERKPIKNIDQSSKLSITKMNLFIYSLIDLLTIHQF